MAQRIFCCKGPRQARLAVISSVAGQVVTALVMLVGVGLYAYYLRNPLTGEALEAYEDTGDRIFPVFILSVIPTGLTGLIIAGVFAAAISSLDSILAALSQTTMSAFYLPYRRRKLSRRSHPPVPDPCEGDAEIGTTGHASTGEERRTVFVSRLFVVFWGIVLCLTAQLTAVASRHYPSILDLGLAMAGYASGALLAGFLMAFLRLGVDGSGYLWSAPLSVLVVFAIAWHQTWAHYVCWAGGGILLVIWIAALVRRTGSPAWKPWSKTLVLIIGIALMLSVSHFGFWEGPVDPETETPEVRTVAWPWYAPVGCTVALAFGYALGRPRKVAANP